MKIVILLLALFFFIGLLAGIQFNKYTQANYNPNLDMLDGRWNRNGTGDWVSVNVEGMSFERCVEVVKHECAHELFAEVCESDTTMCLEVQEILNNYTKNE